MSEGSWIRVSAIDCHLDANTINRIVEKIMGEKMPSVTNDPDLRQTIGEQYVQIVTKYVPMRPIASGGGTLMSSGRATDDGRVYWTAVSPKGYNYAAIQYENENFKHDYPRTDHWTDKVSPGTRDWQEFIDNITPIIIERFKNG